MVTNHQDSISRVTNTVAINKGKMSIDRDIFLVTLEMSSTYMGSLQDIIGRYDSIILSKENSQYNDVNHIRELKTGISINSSDRGQQNEDRAQVDSVDLVIQKGEMTIKRHTFLVILYISSTCKGKNSRTQVEENSVRTIPCMLGIVQTITSTSFDLIMLNSFYKNLNLLNLAQKAM